MPRTGDMLKNRKMQHLYSWNLKCTKKSKYFKQGKLKWVELDKRQVMGTFQYAIVCNTSEISLMKAGNIRIIHHLDSTCDYFLPFMYLFIFAMLEIAPRASRM
jgi:hypothetical protein